MFILQVGEGMGEPAVNERMISMLCKEMRSSRLGVGASNNSESSLINRGQTSKEINKMKLAQSDPN